MKNCASFLIMLTVLLISCGQDQAAVYKDDFHRPDQELSAGSPGWAICAGNKGWHQIKGDQVSLPSLEAYRVTITNRPAIDGKLLDKCWSEAPVAVNFWKLDGSERVKQSARVQLAYDGQVLYVAFWCPLESAEAVKRAREATPEALWGDNTVELFLAPFTDDSTYYHFVVNAANGRFCELNGNYSLSIPWRSATHIGEDFWSAEIAIPFASLAGPNRMGSEWKLNLTCGATCWAPTFGSFHAVRRFGRLGGLESRFGDYRWGLQVGTGEVTTGDEKIAVHIVNQTGKRRRVRVEFAVATTPFRVGNYPYGGNDVALGSNSVQMAVLSQGVILPPDNLRGIDLIFPTRFAEPGTYQASVSLKDLADDRPLAFHATTVHVREPLVATWDRSYYMTERSAKLTISGPPHRSKGARLICALKPVDESQSVEEQTVQLDQRGQAVAVFDIKNISVGDHELIITPAKTAGLGETSLSKILRKLSGQPGAVQCTDHGVLLRDGKPFFPFGLYYIQRYLKDQFVKEYAEAGFNTFVMEWMNASSYVQMAKEMQQYNLVPIVGIQNMSELQKFGTDYSKKGIDERVAVARNAMGTISKEAGANILAWYTRDEPDASEAMHDLVKGLHEAVQQVDGYHPSLTVLFQPPYFPAYADATDILAPDPYPGFPGGRLRKVADYVDAALAAIPSKPVLAVLQTFSEAGGCMPTPAELRCMTYLSIVHGAKGVLYFSYDYRVGPMVEKNPRTWQALKELAGEIRELAQVILSDEPTGLTLKQTGTQGIDARLYKHNGVCYLLAVNSENRRVRGVQYSLKGEGAARTKMESADVLFERRQVVVRNGSWRDNFDPYAVHIYRMPGRNSDASSAGR